MWFKYLLCLEVRQCHLSLRACAAAALKDVAAYFTKEQGQVAVSKQTTRIPADLAMFNSHQVRTPPVTFCLSPAGVRCYQHHPREEDNHPYLCKREGLQSEQPRECSGQFLQSGSQTRTRSLFKRLLVCRFSLWNQSVMTRKSSQRTSRWGASQ